MDNRSEGTKINLSSCIEEIIYLVDEKSSPINNRQLIKICCKTAENFGSNTDPHFYHEIAETALNRAIRDKYASKLLLLNDPELWVNEVLRPLAERLPTQTWRSDEQIVRQQFSTPPVMACLLIYLLNLRENEIALEPSAGTGSLACWSTGFGLVTHTNEIDERRNKLLGELGFNPTSFNAEFINDFLPVEIIPDVLIMNPPFSSSGGRTTNNSSKFGFRHVESAIERLKKGGKFGIILGNSAGLDTQTGREFWRKMSVAVSPHVISIVSRFLNKNSICGIFEIENKDAPERAFPFTVLRESNRAMLRRHKPLKSSADFASFNKPVRYF